MEQRDSARRKGECISLPDSEDDILLLSAYESVLLFSTERMTNSFSAQRRECVLHTKEGVSFCYQHRRQIPSLDRRRSVFSIYREEGASFLHKAQSVPLLYVEEADSFFVQKRECLL